MAGDTFNSVLYGVPTKLSNYACYANDDHFLWPLVIVQDRSLLTLPVGMTIFSQPYRGDPIVGAAMAVSLLATMPVALLFIFF